MTGLLQVGDEAVEAWGFAGAGWKSITEEIGFGGVDSVGLALVGGQGADEGEDLGDVGVGGWTDGEHGFLVGLFYAQLTT
jgi:hypothetical protein